MKKNKPTSFCKLFIYIFILFVHLKSYSQKEFSKKNIDSVFINYTKLYQEVVYTHLNKTTYLKGESIGFTSYVVDKINSNLSPIAKNLYCVITDKKNNIIKKKLVKIEKGVAYNVFEVDSLFTTGKYVFKAYTNWMQNFKQQNYYQEQFNVIDTEESKYLEPQKSSFNLDLQFLPEGGHFIDNVIATVGVIAKDSIGKGVSNIKGEIVDENNTFVTSFKLNNLGIGRCTFIPKFNKSYKAVGTYKGKKYSIALNNLVELKGVNLKIKRVRNEIFISLLTNKATLKNIQNKSFFVANSNSSKLGKISFQFSNDLKITKKISLEKQFSGINIFTLFNSDNKPIAERLFFNYNGISILKSSKASITNRKQDSLMLTLKYDDFTSGEYNNVSVSVLPLKTKSYQKNNTIISQLLIRPYIKSKLENAAYYFTNITERKKYDLDNLLITQGWSSYDWNELFKEEYTTKYVYENGINIQINLPKNQEQNKLYIHRSSSKSAQIIDVEKGLGSFSSTNYFPIDKENLHISTLNKKGKLSPASLYLQFLPNHIPIINTETKNLIEQANYFEFEEYVDSKIFSSSLNETQRLKEITIRLNARKERVQKIKRRTSGDVYFFDEDGPYKNIDIFDFFAQKGFIIETTPTLDIVIKNRLNFSVNGAINPILFIDGIQVTSTDQLIWLDSNVIDYIEINRGGIGEGVRGGAGTIRIVTNPNKNLNTNYNTTRRFKFPLTFSKSKKFYTPIYQDYSSNFFQHYGTIDWLPINTINAKGELKLKFKNNHQNSFKLFIEGITEKGKFILEEKTVYVE